MTTRIVSGATIVALLVVLSPITGGSQERFSFFQASTPESVQRMLTLASLGDNDVVVDLGSGDGLIPLMAARMNKRLRGFGVDIDAKLVDASNQRAKDEGVADRVRFEHKNAFDADLRDATVVTMWLFPELMRLLRPVILERARPGTRVLTSTWDLGTWKPDKTDSAEPQIFMWIVPARVAGGWDWELSVAGRTIRYASFVEQNFQMAEAVIRAGDRREVAEGLTLRGADIAFTLNITLEGAGLTRHEFNGKVDGDQIAGTARISPLGQQTVTVPWRARRTERSGYFAPTGIPVIVQAPGQDR